MKSKLINVIETDRLLTYLPGSPQSISWPDENFEDVLYNREYRALTLGYRSDLEIAIFSLEIGVTIDEDNGDLLSDGCISCAQLQLEWNDCVSVWFEWRYKVLGIERGLNRIGTLKSEKTEANLPGGHVRLALRMDEETFSIDLGELSFYYDESDIEVMQPGDSIEEAVSRASWLHVGSNWDDKQHNRFFHVGEGEIAVTVELEFEIVKMWTDLTPLP